MNIRNEASLLIGSALSAISAGLSVFYGSPVFGVVTGTLLGAVVTVYAQSRTQKTAWKRELAVRNADTLYGPLFNLLNSNLATIDRMSAQTGYLTLDDAFWKQITSQYQFYFIPEGGLRDRLGRFFNLISKYNTMVWPLAVTSAEGNEVTKLIREEAQKFYDLPIEQIVYVAQWTNGSNALPIINPLLFGEHPRKVLSTTYPTMNLTFTVQITTLAPSGQPGQNTLSSASDLLKFDSFFKQTVGKVRSLQLPSATRAILQEIHTRGLELKTLLLAYIQQPWSV